MVRRGIVQCNIQLPSMAPSLLSFGILMTLAISLCADLKWRGITAISCCVSTSTTCIINERRFFMCYGLVSAAWRVWEDRCSYLTVFLLHSLPVVALLDSTVFSKEELVQHPYCVVWGRQAELHFKTLIPHDGLFGHVFVYLLCRAVSGNILHILSDLVLLGWFFSFFCVRSTSLVKLQKNLLWTLLFHANFNYFLVIAWIYYYCYWVRQIASSPWQFEVLFMCGQEGLFQKLKKK